ncbi:DUF3817 domain-containing protein [Rarobacter incanus]|uniref:Integral membrane protein n=1 Tax=Rarobacter incanus TaxID=153494 RepID=A0A542SR90_9MICO|nr:DUF3817 domain-containing protein [Rarobacter incanus]TQK77123.1 integral membrane protein [Rarobacter incanus]
MTEPSDTSATGTPTSDPADLAKAQAVIAAARGATTRYRVMAWITGVMLLALCVEMILKYLMHADVSAIAWIPYAHGWIFVVYLVTVFDLWTKMRWSLGRLATMVFSGVVPVMSFVVEARVHRDAAAKADAAQRVIAGRS